MSMSFDQAVDAIMDIRSDAASGPTKLRDAIQAQGLVYRDDATLESVGRLLFAPSVPLVGERSSGEEADDNERQIDEPVLSAIVDDTQPPEQYDLKGTTWRLHGSLSRWSHRSSFMSFCVKSRNL